MKRRFAGKAPVVLLVVFALLAAGGATSAFAALGYEHARAGRILPGVSIEGVDVSNMTRSEAVAAVSKAVRHELDAKVHVTAGKRTWDLAIGQLGVAADVAPVIDRALALNDDYSWVSRVYHRLTHAKVHRSFSVGTTLDPAPLVSFVNQVAKQVARPPTDAGYALEDGKVAMRHAHSGVALEYWVARAQLKRAVERGGGSVKFETKTIAPKVPDDQVGKLIVVSRTSNRLSLYDGFKVERTYPVATARQGFETPPGEWSVVNKVENPTWHNPCLGQPGCWAAGEPAEIGPGPGNPLGTRALYLDASGIRIHGTPEDSSIGTWASHGCIRMHISDSEALYPLVPIGTPVFVVGAPPWGDTPDPGAAG
ncbi:MAG: L,D-transpeptidase family protein [Actinomycetota bacterium]